MRGRRLSREEAKPTRTKSRPGPIPTLGELARQALWVHVYCEARDCHHRSPMRLADVIARFGENASSDVLRTKTRSVACGALGATIRLPSWVNSEVGIAPFPV